MPSCRSCRAPIIWARTERGKKMPLDTPGKTPDELPNGTTFVLRERDHPDGPLAMAASTVAFPDELHYLSHFATCPDRDEHRRPRVPHRKDLDD